MDNKQQGKSSIMGEIHIHMVNTYLKAFIVVILTSVISWKLLWTNISLSELKATDILSIIIALFAMGLSVAFYFKATDTSNSFYDNSYKFTKEMSEILGRIEAGFGERLKHLDEGYSTMSRKFDGLPYGLTKEQAEQKIEKEEEAIEKNEDERQKMIAELINKADMQELEKKEFLGKLEHKEQLLSMMRGRINELTNQVESSEDIEKKVSHISNYLARLMKKGNINPTDILNLPNTELMEIFSRLIEIEISSAFIQDFSDLGYYDHNTNLLTRRGINLLKKVAFRQLKSQDKVIS